MIKAFPRFRLLFAAFLLSVTSSPLLANDVDPELLAALREAVNESSGFENKYAAQVWLVDMSTRLSRYVKKPADRMEMLTLLHKEATRAGLSPELVLSVIHVESLFDPYALSHAGARGLMQVMPFWKKELGREEDNLFQVATNLRYGCTILAHYLKKEKGNLQRALARYNGSLGKTWYPERVLIAWEKHWYLDRS